MITDLTIDGYNLLRSAVVKQAATDYMIYMCQRHNYPKKHPDIPFERTIGHKNLVEVTMFFSNADTLSQWTDLNGAVLLKDINKLLEDCGFDIRKVHSRVRGAATTTARQML